MAIIGRVGHALWQMSTMGLDTGLHVTRFAMYEQLRGVGARVGTSRGSALSVSHSRYLLDVMGSGGCDIVDANYPETNILRLPFGDGQFDVVASDQVLEHVEGDPQVAIDECLRVLKPDGIAVHTTCFINPVHGHPSDFWRFTPSALAYLHRAADIVACAGWGNVGGLFVIVTGGRMVRVPMARWHPLNLIARRNNPRWPISTWVVARKRPA